jgi:hypothetical protein
VEQYAAQPSTPLVEEKLMELLTNFSVFLKLFDALFTEIQPPVLPDEGGGAKIQLSCELLRHNIWMVFHQSESNEDWVTTREMNSFNNREGTMKDFITFFSPSNDSPPPSGRTIVIFRERPHCLEWKMDGKDEPVASCQFSVFSRNIIGSGAIIYRYR